jgi:hypothetical protein
MLFRTAHRVIEPGATRVRTMPTLARRAVNAARAVSDAARSVMAGDSLRSTPEEQDRRLGVCSACEWFRADAYRGTGGCAHDRCGCAVRAKTWIRSQRCPDGRW